MVLRVCERVLHDRHGAQDAFQATFLVFVRKASSISDGTLLANWLYGVAYRVAARARGNAAKRSASGGAPEPSHTVDPAAEVSGREVCAAIDDELHRLPTGYRAAFLLCIVEGQTRDHVAQQLGFSLRTLTRRLDRARELLCQRLSRRGITLSGALTAAFLAPQGGNAAVPALLMVSTVKAAALFAAGKPATATGVSVNAAVLAEGVLKVMSSQKITVVTLAVVLALGLVSGTAYVYKALAVAEPPTQESRLGSTPEGPEAGGGSWKELRTLQGHGHFGMSYVKFSADGKILATVGQFGPVKFWDTTNWKNLGLVRLHQIYPEGFVAGVVLSPDNKSAVVFGKKKGADDKPSHLATLVDVPDGTERAVLPGGQAWYSPNGKSLAVGTEEGIALYEVAGAKKLAFIQPGGNWILASPNGVRFSPDGRLLATSHKGKVMTWDAADGKKGPSWDGYLPSVNSKDSPFSPDGKTLVVAGFDRTVHLIDLTTGKTRAALTGHSLPYVTTAYSRDGKTLLTTGHYHSNHFGIEPLEGAVPAGSEDALKRRPVEVKLWDVATGKERLSLPGETFDDDRAQISHDGKSVIYQCAHEGEKAYRTVVWDIAENKERVSLPERLGMISPDGEMMESWNGADVTLWALATGRQVTRLQGGEKRMLTHADFSPDGAMLVTSAAHFDPQDRQGDAAKVPTEIKLWRRVPLAQKEIRPGTAPTKAQDSKGSKAPKGDGPGNELQGLQAELGASLSALSREIPEGDKRDEAVHGLLEDYTRRALTLATKDPTDPAAIGALEYAVRLGGNPGPKLEILRSKAIDLLARDHLDSPDLAQVFPALVNLPFRPAEKFLRTALTKSPHRDVKGQACFHLAQYLQKQADALVLLKQQPELSRELERRWGASFLKQWPAGEPQQLAKEAEDLYTRVAKEYAEIKVGDRPLGVAAEAALFELRNLAVGKVAPEIEGEDLEGKKFKLSDYRGKVVVLDFWGHWCGPCRAIYPHGRALVKRLEGKPFAIIGINSDADREDIRLAAKKEGVTWRFWLDGRAPGPIARRWNVETWPTIYVLDANGVIRFRQVREQALDNAIDALLKEQEDKTKAK
jgi:RNA polymerase sigma factor (sigma-70 family)